MSPRLLACALVILALTGCGAVTAQKTGRGTRLVYKCNAPEGLTGNSNLTAFYRNEMERQARQHCPSGFRKLGEGHVVRPPDQSFSYWDITCL